MKLQRSTWILLTSALLLGGTIYFYENQVAPQKETVKTTKKQIFTFKEEQIKSLTIYLNKKPLEIVKIERISAGKTPWLMKYPQDVPASDATVSFLVNLLVEGKSDRTINNISAAQLKEYGLDAPQAKVKIELNDGKIHRIIVGKLDFNRSFLYAQVDPYLPNNQKSEVLLIPVDFQYAVNRPLAEWKPSKSEQPQTPTPTNTPTPNNSPNTQITPSPDVKKPSQEKPQPSPTSTTPSQKPQPSPTSTTPSPQKPQPSPTSTTPSPQKPQSSP